MKSRESRSPSPRGYLHFSLVHAFEREKQAPVPLGLFKLPARLEQEERSRVFVFTGALKQMLPALVECNGREVQRRFPRGTRVRRTS